jgi:hypothetical protein
MLDAHPPELEADDGERLSPQEYVRDFRRYGQLVHDAGSWRLGRRQDLCQPRVVAPAAGGGGGPVIRRVRVVAEPLTPSVRQELLALRGAARAGAPVRVVSAEALAPLEAGCPLPELVTLGGHVLYRVLHTAQGRPDGAVRFTDPFTIGHWERFLAGLFDAGEDLSTYLRRRAARLPQPVPR